MAVKVKKATDGKTPSPSPGASLADFELTVKYIAVNKVVPYDKNPRINDHAVERMVANLREFGFTVPLVVRGKKLVDGHLRLKAAKQLGVKRVPSIDVSHLSDMQVKALRLAINKSAEWADWDENLLAMEMQSLLGMGYDMNLLGFDPNESQDLLKGLDERGGFLDNHLSTGPGDDVTLTPAATGGGTVTLVFNLTVDDRTEVMERLNAVKQDNGLATAAEALLHVMKKTK